MISTNKKANIGNVILIIFVLFLVMIVGVMFAFGGMVVDWTFDEVVPEILGLGIVGDANLTEIADYTVTPVNNVVQSISWFTGLAYVLILVICIGLAYVCRFTGSKWLMGFFISSMILLVIASIFISNIYEDFYTGTSDVAVRLQEQAMISWLILYSPVVICIIGFVCGIIMFTGDGEENSQDGVV